MTMLYVCFMSGVSLAGAGSSGGTSAYPVAAPLEAMAASPARAGSSEGTSASPAGTGSAGGTSAYPVAAPLEAMAASPAGAVFSVGAAGVSLAGAVFSVGAAGVSLAVAAVSCYTTLPGASTVKSKPASSSGTVAAESGIICTVTVLEYIASAPRGVKRQRTEAWPSPLRTLASMA